MSPQKRLPDSVSILTPLLVQDAPIWFVGGGVRDHLLGRKTYDLDFAVDGDAIAIAKRVADQLDGYYYTLDETRGTGRVIHEDENGQRQTLDFARLRGDDITTDLVARDFTINAMAVNLLDPEEWLDPTGGVGDLKDKILRACRPDSISNDPVRALRAVRLAIDFDLVVDPETLIQIRAAQDRLGSTSPERVRDEFFQIFNAERPGRAVRLLNHLDLLSVVFPELMGIEGLFQPPPHAYFVLEHSLSVVDRMGDLLTVLGFKHDPEEAADMYLAQITLRLGRFRDQLNHHLNQYLSDTRTVRQLIYLAALGHDIGKSMVTADQKASVPFERHEIIGAEMMEQRGKNLRLSNKEILRLGRIIRHQEKPFNIGRSAPILPREIYRYFRETGEAGIEVIILSMADFLGTYVPPAPQSAWQTRVEVARTLLEAYFDEHDRYIDPIPLLRGDEIITKFEIQEGPQVGLLLEQLREAQAAGEVRTREEAHTLLARAVEVRRNG
jgi:tRNA nucleotidyltransferase/poly(A) polymerase